MEQEEHFRGRVVLWNFSSASLRSRKIGVMEMNRVSSSSVTIKTIFPLDASSKRTWWLRNLTNVLIIQYRAISNLQILYFWYINALLSDCEHCKHIFISDQFISKMESMMLDSYLVFHFARFAPALEMYQGNDAFLLCIAFYHLR